MKYLHSTLKLKGTITIADYTTDMSNSVFVSIPSHWAHSISVRTTNQSQCGQCTESKGRIIYTADVCSWVVCGGARYIRCLDCCSKHSGVSWPRVNVTYGELTDDTMKLTVVLTLLEMLINIATTPPGKFCCSCRVFVGTTKYGIATVCERCAEHLRRYTVLWWNVHTLCAISGVPREVASHAYCLML